MQEQSWWLRLGLMVAIVLAANGCASSDTQSSDEAQRMQESDAGSTQAALSWAEIYDRVMVPNDCVRCHGKAAKLDLSLEHGYENLVGVVAQGGKCASSAMQRVQPGDPDNSVLLDKLLDVPMCGARMPMGDGKPAVSAEHLELVRAWIAQGAEK